MLFLLLKITGLTCVQAQARESITINSYLALSVRVYASVRVCVCVVCERKMGDVYTGLRCHAPHHPDLKQEPSSSRYRIEKVGVGERRQEGERERSALLYLSDVDSMGHIHRKGILKQGPLSSGAYFSGSSHLCHFRPRACVCVLLQITFFPRWVLFLSIEARSMLLTVGGHQLYYSNFNGRSAHVNMNT